MSRDTVPTVLAAEWDAHANMFDGETASGPIPRLFAADPTEAKSNLQGDPGRAHKDLQRIFSKLGVTENVPASAAFELVLNPR
jgi:hypothetical protein